MAETLLQLLTVPIGVGVLDLALDLGDTGLYVGLGAKALDDRGRVLVDDDLAGTAEKRDVGVLQLEADLLGDGLAAGQDRDIGEHGLAPVTEPGCLDRHALERAPQLVDDQGGEGLAVDVFGYQQQRLAGLS